MTPKKLRDLAQVVRSKNAGPLQVTIDVMFPDKAIYERVAASAALSASAVAQLYGVAEETVTVIPYAAAHAVKIVLDRPIIAGTPGDRDVYGAQQHAPLLEIIP